MALNRAVAVAMVHGPESALSEIDAIAADDAMDRYPYLHAARGELLRRCGRIDEARAALERARDRTGHAGERRLLERKIAALDDSGAAPDRPSSG